MTMNLRCSLCRPGAKVPIPDRLGNFVVFLTTITEDGHEPRIVLSPRSTRAVPTGLIFKRERLFATIPYDLLMRSVGIGGLFPIPPNEELVLPLYNGGFESLYLTHHQPIAVIVPFDLTEETEEIRND